MIWYVSPTLALYAEAEVAHDTPDIGDPDYFPGPNLSGIADANYDLLIGMLAITAVTRWIL